MKTLWKLFTALSLAILISTGAYASARVQVIHNSIDPAAEVVDVWLDDILLIDNFSFRNATPFIDAPSGTEFTISIAGPSSQGPDEAIWTNAYTLAEDHTYVLIANGIAVTNGLDIDRTFDLYVYDLGREEAMMAGNTDVMVYHGSNNVPKVDIVEIGKGAGSIVDDLGYGEFTGYLELPTADYILEIRNQNGQKRISAYSAPLETLGLQGAALVAVASGYLSEYDTYADFGIWVALPAGGEMIPLPVFEPGNARVQVIHNSADAAAEMVDVWLNGDLLIDDFMFRTATPFVDLPSGINLNIAIQGPASTSAMNPIWSNDYVLEDGKSYVLVANGIVSSSGYEPTKPFDIWVYDMGQEMAMNKMNTDVLVFHGSTDAPTVDVIESGVGAGTVVDDLTYGDFAGYLQLPTADYILDITDETGENTVISYVAPLATLGLEDAALVTVASGFLNPANNSNGEAFGLWAALPSGGDLIALPVHEDESLDLARVQVIHNAADAAAEVVDVWLNDVLLLDDFSFRTASPFVDAPAGEEFTISIKGADSMNPNDPIWSQNYTLEAGKTYVLVANGIVSESGYDPVQPFDVYVYDMGQEEAMMTGNTDVLVFHGSTDAPAVDVVEIGKGAGTIINDIAYGEFSGYLALPTEDYVLSITDNTGENTVVSYSAPLSSLNLSGAALVTVASGFLNPDNNSNGEAFGLWVALPSGGELIQLPTFVAGTSRVQVIHNAADLAAEMVDVWLNDDLLLDDFMFRTASPFIDAPAGINLRINIKGPDSMDPNDPIWTNDYVLEDGMTYVLIANGIVSASGYDPAQPFDIHVYDMGREEATSGDNTDVLVFHGSTDAPTVDVVETGVGAGTIIDDFMYGDFAGYLELPTDNYVLEIRDETGTTTVAAYDAPLSTLGLDGTALSVVASGFLNTGNNSNGPGFGLWVALPSGGELIPLPESTTGVDELAIAADDVNVFPNPASQFINIQYSLVSDSEVTINVVDVLGNVVQSTQSSAPSDLVQNHRLELNDLQNGLYFVSIQAGSSQVVKKIQVVN